MTGNALGDDPIRRDHDGTSVGFCSADCATKWDAMTADERNAKVGGK